MAYSKTKDMINKQVKFKPGKIPVCAMAIPMRRTKAFFKL